jgi:hypothetical protein|uniref:Uncharacterized protein n=2 Tax=Picea TaxID=3328 RepID=A0A101LU88_PICGL|nr:hypothetical protein ABT39_MTgene3434 [Picea glauca]QHR92714.1 hypothetical protein Q903MT_gene6762 [Picea sitchensis]
MLGASHAIDGVIGSIAQTSQRSGQNKLFPNSNMHLQHYGGASTYYTSTSYGHPSVPHSHPHAPHDPSRLQYKTGASTSSSGQPTHPLVHGPACNGTSCGASKNPYYPFFGPPPSPSIPPTQMPQSQTNMVQPAPPQQGQVYAQQNVLNLPNKQNNGGKKKNKGKGQAQDKNQNQGGKSP